MSQNRYCGTTVQAEAQGPTDPGRPSHEKGRGLKSGGHHISCQSHGPLFRVAPNLARDLKKVDGMGSIQFAVVFRHSLIAWLVIYHVFWLTPFSINRLGLDRSGQFPGIEFNVTAHVMLVATGRWSWGWWYHCAGWLRLVFWLFSSLLLHVILNQNLNSTHFCSTGDEIKKCDDS